MQGRSLVHALRKAGLLPKQDMRLPLHASTHRKDSRDQSTPDQQRPARLYLETVNP